MIQVARFLLVLAAAKCLVACSSSGSSAATGPSHPDAGADAAGLPVNPVPLPDGAPGIGFDDLRYAPVLKKVLAPGGRSGNLDLVDPTTLAVDAIGGFSTSSTFTVGSHSSGTTSADEGVGVIYAIDHETLSLRVIDSTTKAMVARATLAADPDYVRWVPSSGEVWVTEPGTGLEVFSVSSGGVPTHAATLSVSGGPEGIAVDSTRHRVYTDSFVGQTFAVDIPTRSVVETWTNGCSSLSLGVALDEARGFVFVACSGGSVVVLDAAHGGTKLGQLTVKGDLDILSFSPKNNHLYVPGGTSAELSVVGISAAGVPTLLGTAPTAQGSKEVTADDEGNAWVADQGGGRLLRIKDTFPATP